MFAIYDLLPHKLCSSAEPDPCCHTQRLQSLRFRKTMSGRPTQFASKTGVGTAGRFLCSNAPPLDIFLQGSVTFTAPDDRFLWHTVPPLPYPPGILSDIYTIYHMYAIYDLPPQTPSPQCPLSHVPPRHSVPYIYPYMISHMYTIYDLLPLPPLDIFLQGSVTFTAPDGRFLWHTVRPSPMPPPYSVTCM